MSFTIRNNSNYRIQIFPALGRVTSRNVVEVPAHGGEITIPSTSDMCLPLSNSTPLGTMLNMMVCVWENDHHMTNGNALFGAKGANVVEAFSLVLPTRHVEEGNRHTQTAGQVEVVSVVNSSDSTLVATIHVHVPEGQALVPPQPAARSGIALCIGALVVVAAVALWKRHN